VPLCDLSPPLRPPHPATTPLFLGNSAGETLDRPSLPTHVLDQIHAYASKDLEEAAEQKAELATALGYVATFYVVAICAYSYNLERGDWRVRAL